MFGFDSTGTDIKIVLADCKDTEVEKNYKKNHDRKQNQRRKSIQLNSSYGI